MSYCPDNALIIQSDRTVLLDVHAPRQRPPRRRSPPLRS
jgi:hypothetical protein